MLTKALVIINLLLAIINFHSAYSFARKHDTKWTIFSLLSAFFCSAVAFIITLSVR